MTEPEEWRPVVGFEGYYEVSSLGRIKSLERTYDRRGHPVRVRERIMKPTRAVSRSGHLSVGLRKDGVPKTLAVHRLVALAFIANPDGLPSVLHWNDIPNDNRVENLRWGDARDNAHDLIRNGRDPDLNKTHCPKNHPYDEGNTYVTRRGGRICRTCRLQGQRMRAAYGMPDPRDSRHGTLTGYSYGCRCPQCKEARNEYTNQYRPRGE